MRIIIIVSLVLSLIMINFAQEDIIKSENASFWYVYMEFSGGYQVTQQNIGMFYQVIQSQNIQSQYISTPLILYFDSFLLDADADTSWGLGIRLDEKVTVTPPLKIAKYEYEKVLTMDFIGQYQMPSTGYNYIVPYIYENKFKVIGPPIEIWLDNPNQKAPDSCRTEIYIPVMSKSD